MNEQNSSTRTAASGPEDDQAHASTQGAQDDGECRTLWFPNQRVWRTLVATAIPAVLGLVVLLPEVIAVILDGYGESVPPGLRAWLIGAAAFITTTSGIVTRVLAIPRVDAWLRRWTPFGSAPRGR